MILAGSSPDGGDTAFFSGGLGGVLRTPEVLIQVKDWAAGVRLVVPDSIRG